MSLVPLYHARADGKAVRDKARRYVDEETGQIISRREQIIRTEGVTPEVKAKIPTKRVRKGQKPKRMIQLAGTYDFEDEDGGSYRGQGFSTAQPKRDYGRQHQEAVSMAMAEIIREMDLEGSDVLRLTGIVEEVWLRF